MFFRKPQALATDLDSFLKETGISETVFAESFAKENHGVRVSQSRVNRLRHGQFKRVTVKVRLVLEYANIPVFLDIEDDHDEGHLLINKAIYEVWDGTIDSALALAEVIRACHRFAR